MKAILTTLGVFRFRDREIPYGKVGDGAIDSFECLCFCDHTLAGDQHFAPADNEASRDFISDLPSG